MSATPSRPRVQTLRSLSTHDAASGMTESPSRSRANTIHTPTIATVPEAKRFPLLPESGAAATSDVFSSTTYSEEASPSDPTSPVRTSQSQLPPLEQLPIEIRSFTERFLKSLSAKSQPAPLNIDEIADLFQDFYIQAESQIATHIAALTTRLSRTQSPAPSVSSRSSIKNLRRTLTNDESTFSGEQQMLTRSEISDKRRARRQLELQRSDLEEAVERSVCVKVYDKLYRHRSTDDEVKDAKLRSKTAALSLIRVGLKELHVNLPDTDDKRHVQSQIYDWLAPAREGIQRMDEEQYPLGKLQHLIAAHQAVVETLAKIFPSTSSADEVLPTLIYTLITCPPESLNVISNLHFIQLFRATNKVDGEAAYCLVNLEAAISFLETVDLSSLKTDDPLLGLSPQAELASNVTGNAELKSLTADLPAVSNPSQKASKDTEEQTRVNPVRPLSTNQRSLSHMFQAQAEKIEAGRDNLFNSADQALDSINSTLENSFKFLFGRLKEQEIENQGSPVIIPKTLDEARRLVKSPVTEESGASLDIGSRSISETLQVAGADAPGDPLTGLIAKRSLARDPSADSSVSASSFRKSLMFGNDESKQATGPAETVGNFVNSLNPLSRFSVGVPGFAKFGRTVSSPTQETSPAERSLRGHAFDKAAHRHAPTPEPASDADDSAAKTLATLRKTKPPVRRFMEVNDIKELRIAEVEELLKDYRRLAEVLADAIRS